MRIRLGLVLLGGMLVACHGGGEKTVVEEPAMESDAAAVAAEPEDDAEEEAAAVTEEEATTVAEKDSGKGLVDDGAINSKDDREEVDKDWDDQEEASIATEADNEAIAESADDSLTHESMPQEEPAPVHRKGKQARIHTSKVVAPASDLASQSDRYLVHALVLNVRSGPGEQHEKVGTLHRGQKVTVLKHKGKWAQISAKEWVLSNYLKSSR